MYILRRQTEPWDSLGGILVKINCGVAALPAEAYRW
jgi:hypothetical protein